jgi:AraC family transcriptional regulator
MTKRREVGRLSLSEALFASEFKIDKHAHSNPLLCMTLAGGCTEKYAGRTHNYGPSGIEYLPANHEHSLSVDRSGMRAFSVEIAGDWLETMQELAPIKADAVFRDSGGFLGNLLHRVHNEFRHFDELSSLIIEGLALELLGALSRRAKATRNRSGRAAPPRWVADAKAVAESHFSESLGLGVVADRLGVHPVQLAREFRKHYRMSMGEYLRQLRVAYVKRQLADTELSLVEIAIAAGFADQSHMSRTFSRASGLTPGMFRNAVRRG